VMTNSKKNSDDTIVVANIPSPSFQFQQLNNDNNKFENWSSNAHSLLADYSCEKAFVFAKDSSTLTQHQQQHNRNLLLYPTQTTTVSSETTQQLLRQPSSTNPLAAQSFSPAAQLLSTRHYPPPPLASSTTNHTTSTRTPSSSSSFWNRKSQADLLAASDEYLKNLELQVNNNKKRSTSATVSTSRTPSVL
jgi:hypothetical protein